MGLFDNLSEVTTSAPPPVTVDRFPPVLESMELNFGKDDDGDLIAGFEDFYMWFMVEAEPDNPVLRLTATWDYRPPVETRPALLEAINKWNSESYTPRAVLLTPPEGDTLRVLTDMLIDCSAGATDQQIEHWIGRFIGTTISFHAELGKHFPEHTGWPNPAKQSS